MTAIAASPAPSVGHARLATVARHVLRLIGSLALTFFGLTVITFCLARVLPIDPVLAVVGDRAPMDVYNRVFKEMGLDRPLYEQYWHYVTQLAHGDFGVSNFTNQPVLEDLAHRFPATIELATIAILIGILFGVPMGVLAAVKQGRWPDHVMRVVGLIGYSMPVFWLGFVGLYIFYSKLGWVAGPGRIEFLLRGHRRSRHRLPADRQLDRGREGHLLERYLPHHPAGIDPRLPVARLYRAHDPQLHAGPAVAGIHPDGAGEGPVAARASSGATRSATSWCRSSR